MTYEINGMKLFQDINVSVRNGDIIAIIGKNGCGKTTLLQLINQNIQPTKGTMQWIQDKVDTVLVEQDIKSFTFHNKTFAEQKLLNDWDVPHTNYDQLSGGEKLKARLAEGLAKQANLLLLDEPTNHLDQESMKMLKTAMQAYEGTIIFVSHDRHFIDEVATRIWEIEDKKLNEYLGNYSDFIEVRKQKRLTQAREYEKQQNMIRQIEGQLNELSSWSKKAHAQSTNKEGYKEYHRKKAKRMDSQIKSKKKRLEKELEKTKVAPVQPEYTVKFTMKANNKVGKRFLEVKNLSKKFGRKKLFEQVNFYIQHGDRVAIVGPNGSGKTTLLKIIMGIESAQGEVWISPAADIGYLTQDVFDLPLDKTPSQLFYRETYEERGKVQNLMKHLGFSALQWNEPIKNMSMGERVKCKLMVFIMEEKDVLILDEPTNHLDIPSREQLEETLSEYNGTLIVVSHDRYFLEKTTKTQLVISNHTIQKKWDSNGETKENGEDNLRLKLETERQEVLGKLSYLTPGDPSYVELDERFRELTEEINRLSK